MAISRSDYRVKRARKNSDFSFDCSETKLKRRKVSARRDFSKRRVQFVSEPEELEAMESEPVHELPEKIQVARKVYARRDFPEAFSANSSCFVKVDREDSESDPEELEAMDSDDDPKAFSANVDKEDSESDPEELVVIDSDDDDPEPFRANSSHFEKVDKEDSESKPEEPEAIDSDDDDPEGFFACCRQLMQAYEQRKSEPKELETIDSDDDDPEPFYSNSSNFAKVDREDSESDPEELEAIDSDDDDPEPFYSNSSNFAKVDKEDSESDPEELEAIDSDDDLITTNTEKNYELEEIDGSSNAKPICSADKMEPEISKDTQNQEPVNQIVGSTPEPLDSSRSMGAGEKRGDYIQHVLASLDQMKATLMKMKQQGAFKKRSAAFKDV
ncbi:PREDICTED: transcription initiation factor TFIID subunit 11-like [Ipomoea nil]|uniref:transcription initiation factor TFIID subunit 11-like n=1 Tax=Ipomoea nil TaxID=35883 RepID=UPI000901C413|nr:PREDICTED: transcription initiation factor TFIID subunit 11-like [Ipomoea nil]